MKKLLQALVEAKLIKSADVDETDAVVQFQAAFAAMSGRAAEADAVKAKLAEAEKENGELVKARASGLVDAAVQTGRIPPKDENAKAFWLDSLVKARDAKDYERVTAALNGLPANDPTKKVIQEQDKGGNQPAEHEFLVKARAAATERKIPLSAAQSAVARENPKLYQGYRESMLAAQK